MLPSFLFAPSNALVFSISFAVNAALIAASLLIHPKSRCAGDRVAIQSAHSRATPRTGGIGIVAAILVALLFLIPQGTHYKPALFCLSLLPVFLAGLAEDFGYNFSPRRRLLAAAMSSVLAIILLQMWIPRADVPGLDHLIGFAPFGIALTIFATAGICNAFNLIDGLNGLSSITGLMTAIGISAIAYGADDERLAAAAFLMVPAIMGFVVFNYPFGRIFLGDAGAYSIGHILSWFAIALILRSAEVSAVAVLLVFFWPTADTILSIYRRKRSGKPTAQPDRLHFHQLVMRAIEIKILGRKNRHFANPLATLIMLPFIAAPIATGVILWNQPLLSLLALVVFGVAFVASYLIGMRLAAVGRRKAPTLPALVAIEALMK